MTTRNAWVAIGILAIVLISVILIIPLSSDPSREDNPPRYNRITFLGDVNAGDKFSMNGTLHMNAFNEKISRFEDVSIRFYAEDGQYLGGECLGSINTTDSIPISINRSVKPDYVVFASPDFDVYETVGDFQIDAYYLEAGEYLPRAWAIPSDLPIDPTRGDPCAG